MNVLAMVVIGVTAVFAITMVVLDYLRAPSLDEIYRRTVHDVPDIRVTGDLTTLDFEREGLEVSLSRREFAGVLEEAMEISFRRHPRGVFLLFHDGRLHQYTHGGVTRGALTAEDAQLIQLIQHRVFRYSTQAVCELPVVFSAPTIEAEGLTAG